jgi:hypothetical protein
MGEGEIGSVEGKGRGKGGKRRRMRRGGRG